MSEIGVAVRKSVADRLWRSFLGNMLVRLVKEKPLGTIGGVIFLVVCLTAIFANVLAPFPYRQIDLASRLLPPSSLHILGTDDLGRDMLSRIIFGARISMIVGLGGSFVSTGVAVIGGVITGYIGGKTDVTVQRFVDAWMCIPSLFLYLTLIAVIGQGLVQVILVIGISTGIHQIRTIRSTVIGIKENVFVEAGKAVGSSTLRIIIKHILPNVMAPIIIIFSVAIGQMILAEATLSFLGLGIPPPTPAWGGMISGEGRTYMMKAPWLAIWPGFALSIVVFGVNMLGDAIRDILDPRLRGGLGRYGRMKRLGSK